MKTNNNHDQQLQYSKIKMCTIIICRTFCKEMKYLNYVPCCSKANTNHQKQRQTAFHKFHHSVSFSKFN